MAVFDAVRSTGAEVVTACQRLLPLGLLLFLLNLRDLRVEVLLSIQVNIYSKA